MHLIDVEICSNCEREIGRSEQAYVFDGKIVCAECDNTLRSNEMTEPPAAPEPITTVEPQFEEPDQSKPDEQEKEKHYRDEDKHPGFIITGAILCIFGILLIGLGLLGLAVSFLESILIGILLAGWLLMVGMLIIILGITSIVVAATSRQSKLR
ncbi:MAG: LIM domain-containing protein [Planctomycetota bacterium]